MPFKDFSEMPVWQKAFDLVMDIYKITKTFPTEEKYGLVSDMRRAATSVTNNIAEGFGRYERLDKTRFYKFSRGSCYELMNQNMVSHALCFLSENSKNELVNGYRDVISGLDSMIKSIETSPKK
ncbi:MAG: four helix bundle protein [Bacteroidales bacterium]|nr:four helix bundle protein [Bacteroidales bacterium]